MKILWKMIIIRWVFAFYSMGPFEHFNVYSYSWSFLFICCSRSERFHQIMKVPLPLRKIPDIYLIFQFPSYNPAAICHLSLITYFTMKYSLIKLPILINLNHLRKRYRYKISITTHLKFVKKNATIILALFVVQKVI